MFVGIGSLHIRLRIWCPVPKVSHIWRPRRKGNDRKICNRKLLKSITDHHILSNIAPTRTIRTNRQVKVYSSKSRYSRRWMYPKGNSGIGAFSPLIWNCQFLILHQNNSIPKPKLSLRIATLVTVGLHERCSMIGPVQNPWSAGSEILQKRRRDCRELKHEHVDHWLHSDHVGTELCGC